MAYVCTTFIYVPLAESMQSSRQMVQGAQHKEMIQFLELLFHSSVAQHNLYRIKHTLLTT